ncbi:MAG: hypothetical protein UY11_C0018G0006 [Candidatus Amesbacteria bacterium GW2011_GWC2_47_8]|uniref:Glycosyltransferase RgtA/B/C/D-like domain-containing protein n=1 Tax=Candidatus Amesbacteria bacterium GW2011_GWC2_47_8 TaxID=1618367 RepID=A0A0G1TNU1_9BACT|nr:MAG: hypothetical protein UY11_C0018G0006 [Candidatus Amesbacteria bacterium GW2011_GWC2_47_8]
MVSKIKAWILLHEAILIILAGVVFLRVPSLFEPYWYGDEGIYLTIGRAMRNGVELYKGIHDNKPPLIYTLAAVADGKQFWFKFILMLWSVATVAVFWNISRYRVWPTAIFALLTTLPLLEGTIANAELFFLVLTIGAWGMLWKKNELKTCFLAGILYGMATLFKAPAGLEAGGWPLVWLIYKDKDWWKKSFWLGIGTVLPVGLMAVYFLGRGTLPEFLTATGVKLIPYLSTWRVDVPILGTLFGRIMLLLGWVGLMFQLKGKLSKITVAAAVWWGVALFAALLSGRPYPHYLLQTAPAMVLLVTQSWIWLAGVGAILTIVIVSFKFYGYHDWAYYQNFLAWVGGRKSHEAYMQWFNPQVKNNYEIARIIKAGSGEGERIFVWGDEPMIYALSRRLPASKYTVKYHVKEFAAQAETIEKLAETLPRYIVVWGNGEDLPGLTNLVRREYMPEARVGEAEVYRLFDHRL